MISTSTLLILVVGLFLVIALIVLFLTVGGGPAISEKARHHAAVSDNLRALVQAQRAQRKEGNHNRENLALAAAAEVKELKKKNSGTSRLTLEKKLRYAGWSITPIQFRAIQLILTLVCFIPALLHAKAIVWMFVLFISPSIVDSFLEYAMNKRFKAFDRDYPVMLLSYVSLLKTGMNSITGLEAAARGLDEESLVRQEVELLIERLRLGLTEEQALNAFGENIHHPELELFVQSLLLNRRLGGTLSATLERLAKQVRKRQQFREQAVAAVALERNSIYMIALIMSLLMTYLAFNSPELVFPAFKNPLGNTILQFGAVLILIGFYWSRKVTNIKV